MSARNTPATYPKNTGGTILTETTNPALLALLRDNSQTDIRTPAAAAAPVSPSVHLQSTAATPRIADRQETLPKASPHPSWLGDQASAETLSVARGLQVTAQQNPSSSVQSQQAVDSQERFHGVTSPQSVSQVTQQGKNFVDSNSVSQGERSGKQSLTVTPVSRDLPSSTNSSSSELARLAGTPSRKSFVLSTTVTEVDSAGGGDPSDTDDEGDDLTPTEGTFPTSLGSTGNLADSDGSETPVNQPEGPKTSSTTRTAPVNSPQPPGGRSSISSTANPLVLHGADLPSPDLQHPDHQRFVTPYASRRLKDHPLSRNSAISAFRGGEAGDRLPVTQKVPKEQSWSATQVGKLKAQVSDVNNNGEADSAAEADCSHIGPDCGDIDPSGSSVDYPRPVDYWKVPPQEEASRVSLLSSHFSATDVSAEEITDTSGAEASDPHLADLAAKAQAELDASFVEVKPSSLYTVKQEDFAHTPKAQTVTLVTSAEATPQPARGQAGDRHSAKLAVEAGAHRVYVESPSFTQEEEEQYRFVSSRVDNYDARHETFRGLDEAAVKSMEGGAAGARPGRKPFKQVRYQDDEERYEDREDILQYHGVDNQVGPGGREPDPGPPPKQYVLKSKNSSALVDAVPPPSKPTQPVRGLVLPSGPSWDPGDEEDLKRETSYQQDLKHRINDVQRRAEETVIPRLPLYGGESEDFARDSLDVPDDIELDSERHNVHHNSLDVYEQQRLQQAMHNTQWDDPPAPPQRAQFAPAQMPRQNRDGYGSNMVRGGPDGYVNNHYQPEMADMDNGQFAGGAEGQHGYSSQQMRPDQYAYSSNPPPQMRPDPYGQRANPHVRHGQSQFAQQPGYYGQQGQQQPPQMLDYQQQQQQQQYMSEVDPIFRGRRAQAARPGHYMEREAPQQNIKVNSSAELKEGFYLTEPRGYAPGVGAIVPYRQDFESNVDDGTAGYYQNDQGGETDRYQLEDDSAQNLDRKGSAPYELGNPQKPSYDYVEHNKHDYGRAPKRTYKKIHEVHKEEKDKLSSIFIQPKVKGKGQGSHRASRDNSSSRYPTIAESPSEEVTEMPESGAEQLWAQRSATLAHAKNPGTKKKQPFNMSALSNSNQRGYQSDGSIPSSAANQQLVPLAQNSNQILQHVNPMQSLPVRRPLELKPITQEIITEDGQRISVDVNLRLISPPLSHPGEGSPGVPISGGEAYVPQWQGAGFRQTGYQYPVEEMKKNGQQYAYQDENEYLHGRYSADDVLNSKNHYSGNGYTTDSGPDYTTGAYMTNPYKKIPPIPTGKDSGAPRSAPVQSEGSYMESYLREKEKAHKGEKPWYKVYGLKDYQRMQKEVRLGSLGPDLDNDTYKERREKKLRQMEYAKTVKVKNTQDLMTKKPPTFPHPREQDDIMSKRKVAVEYAKNVPKPTVHPKPNPYNSYELASQLSPIAKSHKTSQSPVALKPSVEVLDLQKLHERHEQDKRSAALIRQKAQGVLS